MTPHQAEKWNHSNVTEAARAVFFYISSLRQMATHEVHSKSSKFKFQSWSVIRKTNIGGGSYTLSFGWNFLVKPALSSPLSPPLFCARGHGITTFRPQLLSMSVQHQFSSLYTTRDSLPVKTWTKQKPNKCSQLNSKCNFTNDLLLKWSQEIISLA